MWIQLIVLTLAINIIVIAFKNYSVLVNNSKYQDSFDDSILNIERLLKGYMIQSIHVKEDNLNDRGKILIDYKISNTGSDIKTKEIYFEENKQRVVLKTKKNNFQIGFNILMTDVSDFKIIKKKNIYYLKITTLNNYERIICL